MITLLLFIFPILAITNLGVHVDNFCPEDYNLIESDAYLLVLGTSGNDCIIANNAQVIIGYQGDDIIQGHTAICEAGLGNDSCECRVNHKCEYTSSP